MPDPARTRYQVWSIDRAHRRALVVDEGSKADMEESANRRNQAAVKFDMKNLYFACLRAGEEPDWGDDDD